MKLDDFNLVKMSDKVSKLMVKSSLVHSVVNQIEHRHVQAWPESFDKKLSVQILVNPNVKFHSLTALPAQTKQSIKHEAVLHIKILNSEINLRAELKAVPQLAKRDVSSIYKNQESSLVLEKAGLWNGVVLILA